MKEPAFEVVVLQSVANDICWLHNWLLEDKSESTANAICLLKIANMAVNLALSAMGEDKCKN